MRLLLLLCTLPLLLAPLFTGCSTPVRRDAVIGSPPLFPGYPSLARSGAVWAEATFVENHAGRLGEDLTEHRIIPSRVKVGLGGEASGAPRLAAGRLDATLYLQDGTPLRHVPLEDLPTDARRVRERALSLSLLQDWSSAESGYLFFRHDHDVRVQGTHALSGTPRCHRELQLEHSLIAFDVVGDEGVRRLYVGVAPRRVRSGGSR